MHYSSKNVSLYSLFGFEGRHIMIKITQQPIKGRKVRNSHEPDRPESCNLLTDTARKGSTKNISAGRENTQFNGLPKVE